MANTPGLVKGAAVALVAGASAGRSRRRSCVRRSRARRTHIGWLRDFLLIDRWLRRCRDTEKPADALDTGFSGGAGQESVVPDAMEAPRQDVQEETADELAGIERQRFVPRGTVLAVILDKEGDVRPIEGGDVSNGVGRDPLVGQHSAPIDTQDDAW